jgi:hypothetical protein
MKIFLAVIFLKFLVIKALDPDWIRIRIGIHPKMLDPDPDPDEMNADPQPCCGEWGGRCFSRPTPYCRWLLDRYLKTTCTVFPPPRIFSSWQEEAIQ